MPRGRLRFATSPLDGRFGVPEERRRCAAPAHEPEPCATKATALPGAATLPERVTVLGLLAKMVA